MKSYVIVGMGAAGFSAAEMIRQHRPDAAVSLITEEPHGYYSRPGLAFVLNNELSASQLSPRSDRDFDQLGLGCIIAQVARLEPENRQIVLADGRHLPYDALLLATGAAAIHPPFPGADLPGVVSLDNMDDARRILRLARRAKTAVVVGGGITALELVEGLQAQKVRVHYFLRRKRFWSSVLDAKESRLVEDRLAHEGVQIHRHTEIRQILAQKDWRGRHKVAAVETKDGRTISCQMVGIAIGVRPRLELLNGSDIQVDRGILVNERLETSVPGIYAAGDVAQVVDPLTGQAQLDVLWPVAAAQGRAAGANMAGVPTIYRKGVPLNVTRLAGMIVTLIGAVGQRSEPDGDLITISRGDSEVWCGIPGVLTVHDYHDINSQRLMIKDNPDERDASSRLVGAVIIGDQALSPIVQRLIERQVDIGPILPDLQATGTSIADALLRLSGVM